jgi:hypothetical protein
MKRMRAAAIALVTQELSLLFQSFAQDLMKSK